MSQFLSIGTQTAMQLLRMCNERGLPYSAVLVEVETALALMVAGSCKLAGSTVPERYCTEMMNSVTEAAQTRVMALVRNGTL